MVLQDAGCPKRTLQSGWGPIVADQLVSSTKWKEFSSRRCFSRADGIIRSASIKTSDVFRRRPPMKLESVIVECFWDEIRAGDIYARGVVNIKTWKLVKIIKIVWYPKMALKEIPTITIMMFPTDPNKKALLNQQLPVANFGTIWSLKVR